MIQKNCKKIAFALCASIMMLSVTACGNTNNGTNNNANNTTNGNDTNAEETTYSGTAQGYGGDVTVTIAVAGGMITGVTAQGDAETPEIGGNAIAAYNEDGFDPIIGSNVDAVDATSIDAVTGATYTSEAVEAALEVALEKVQ